VGVRVFVGKAFRKWAGSESISDEDLCTAAKEAFDGNVEGDLGGYLFKKRVARTGGGKSGGFRTIIGFRKKKSDRIFFLYGFSKSSRSNITRPEQAALSINAKALIETNDEKINALKEKGTILELECKS
jgi:hypothetical protein